MIIITFILLLIFFITWGFISWIGIIGIGLIIAFYYLIFYSGLKNSKKKIEFFKEDIISHFAIFGERTGEEHYNYIYESSNYFLMPLASKAFSAISSMITIGSLVVGIISIFKANWGSLVFCVGFYFLSARLASKYNKPYFDLKSVRGFPMDEFELEYNLNGYWDFFKNVWPQLLNRRN